MNRNELINPESSLEIATHSIDTAITVDATLNWWGSPIPGASTVTDLDEYHRVIAGGRHKLTILSYRTRFPYDAIFSNNLVLLVHLHIVIVLTNSI